ncbi:TPR repeat-containing protein [Natronincola peptidivorans]|uniref:TPR repeat-containing protein n=1 Tax=Natronincola peptidivorans TaxID=426128 RepID=A0A1I0FP43_9FIRM|nr:tetratricopeptide repeat protein [Natronincola peptidivorans]SET59909.1 TPR repeat-containing protein [Natronincola peptidivorans]
MKDLCENKGLWLKKEKYEKYPEILVHEYKRMFTMLEEGQTSGVLLQIKDMFEIMLKLPVLAAISQIYHQEEWNQEGKGLLYSIVKKPLALGDWRNIANRLGKNKDIDINVIKLIQKIAKQYKDYDLVEWRNTNIGHGALKLDTDASFKEDLEEKIALITGYFDDEEIDNIYTNFKISTQESFQPLEENQQAIETIQSIIVMEKEVPMFPYMFIENNQLFFYDTYYSRKKKTHMLNYTHGIKKEVYGEIHQKVTALHKTLRKDGDLYQDMLDDQDASLEDPVYFQIERMVLEEIYNAQEITRPFYLEEWVKGCLEKEKGIFLLQMERGMGKTTFSRALDQLKNHTVKIKNTTVRGYYFNDTYGSKAAAFASGLTYTLKRGKKAENTPLDYEVEALEGEIEGIHTGLQNKKEAMIKFLRLCSSKRRKKLLLILDGIDEIPENEIQEIFAFLPPAQMLPENVYIFITSRVDEELAEYTKKQLNTLGDVEKLKVHRNDENNIEILKSYIKKRVLGLGEQEPTIQEKKKIEKILQLCENRFLYLNALKEITTSTGQANLDALLEGQHQIFQYYLKVLRSHYGEKYFYHIKKILCILAIAYEPLTIREIAYLMGDEKRSFKLLGFLKDIGGFLKTERSNRESNVISIGHKKLQETIQLNYASEIKELILSWCSQFEGIQVEESEDKDYSSAIYDGEQHLTAHILYYVTYYLKKDKAQRGFRINPAMFSKIFNLNNQYLFHEGVKEYQVVRGLAGYANLLDYEAFLSDELITKIQMNQGILRSTIGETGNAIPHFLKAIKHLKNKMPRNIVENKELLAQIYYNLAISCRGVWQLSDALKYANEAMKLLEQLHKRGELSLHRLLLDIYIERTTILEEQHRIEEAYKSVEKAVDYVEALRESNHLEREALTAFTYSKRANVRDAMGDYEGAMEDYREAITILENSQNQEEGHPQELTYQYLNFGVTYANTHKHQEAISYYNKALELIDALKKQQAIINRSLFFNLYNNRGQAYFHLDRHPEAIEDYHEAIVMLEDMRKDKEIDNAILYIYMDAYMNRAASYAQQEEYTAAIQDLDKTIEVREELVEDFTRLKKSFDYISLAEAYLGRGSIKDALGERQPAIDDYQKGLQYFEKSKSSPKLNHQRIKHYKDRIQALMKL